MSEQLKTAFVRALGIGAVSAASTALSTWASDTTGKSILAAAGTAFLAPFVARFGGEGTYDTSRAQRGDVKPSDVKVRKLAA